MDDLIGLALLLVLCALVHLLTKRVLVAGIRRLVTHSKTTIDDVAGAAGVAVMGGVMGDADPEAAVRGIVAAIE